MAVSIWEGNKAQELINAVLQTDKVDKQQGTANAGKALIVGSDGLVGFGNVGLSDNAKTALINCLKHVAWVDENGLDYVDALEEALGLEPSSSLIYDWDVSSGTNPPGMTGTFDSSAEPGALRVSVPNLTVPIDANNWEVIIECKFNSRPLENNPKMSFNGYISESDNLNIQVNPNASTSVTSEQDKMSTTINWAADTKVFTEYTVDAYRKYRITYINGTMNIYIDNNLIRSSGKVDSDSHVDANAFKIVCGSTSTSAHIFIKSIKVKAL